MVLSGTETNLNKWGPFVKGFGAFFRKKTLLLYFRHQLVEHLPADLVVLEQAEAGAGGAHDDGSAFADSEAVGEGFLERGEYLCLDLEAGLRQGLQHALRGGADECHPLEVRAVFHENLREFGEVRVLLGAAENQREGALHAGGRGDRRVGAGGVAVVEELDAVLFALEFHTEGEGLVALEGFEGVDHLDAEGFHGEGRRRHVLELVDASHLAVREEQLFAVDGEGGAVNHGVSVAGAGAVHEAYRVFRLGRALACNLRGRLGVFQVHAGSATFLPTHQVSLGVAVFLDALVPVQVLGRYAQYNAHVGRDGQGHQLETRKLEDAHAVGRFRFEQVERRYAEVAANLVVYAALGKDVANHAHGGALAESPGDAYGLLGFSLF